MASFEDAVIFVHDVEHCLEQLDEFSQKLIAKVVLQEYTQEEAARSLNCWRRTVGRRLPDALDQLSELFLTGGLLVPLAGTVACQEAECAEKGISDCEYRQ